MQVLSLRLTNSLRHLMQVMYDPSPSPPADRFSGEFRSFVDVCLLKEAEARPTAEQVRKFIVL